MEEHQLLYLRNPKSRLFPTISDKIMLLNTKFSFLPRYMLYNFNAAASAPAVLGACPSVQVLKDIAAMSELRCKKTCKMMLVLVLTLLVRAGLRTSTTCRPWYIAYVSWFLYLLLCESEAVSLENSLQK